MRLELHAHSHYSRGSKLPTEGISSPRDIIRTAKRIGLQGVALTDHNVIKGWKEARIEAKKLRLLFIPGIEISSREGHIIALGITEHVPRNLSIDETVERIHELGGLAVAPHPFDIKGDGVREAFVKADAAEVFNSLNLDRFSNWVMRKKVGSFPATVGSDAHTLEMIGKCINMVDAHTLDDILKEIKKGNVKHVTSYVKVGEVKDWAHQRFQKSEDFVARRIAAKYPPFKKWLSLRLLNKFLNNQGGFFTLLGHFGIACSYGYGGVRAITSL